MASLRPLSGYMKDHTSVTNQRSKKGVLRKYVQFKGCNSVRQEMQGTFKCLQRELHLWEIRCSLLTEHPFTEDM